jgi:hypothetical protein
MNELLTMPALCLKSDILAIVENWPVIFPINLD